MLKDMFAGNTSAVPQPNQPPAPPAPVVDYSPAFLTMNEVLGMMLRRLDEMSEAQKRAPQTKSEIVTLDSRGWQFDDKGYKYFGFMAKQATVLSATFNNLTFPISLQPGYSDVVLPGGATLSVASGTTTLVAVWSDYLEVADRSNTESAKSAAAITPDNVKTFAPTRGLYVGTAGDIKMTMTDGTVVTRKAVSAGMTHPWSVSQVWATGTTAADIIGDY